jgi:hypothetical protein
LQKLTCAILCNLYRELRKSQFPTLDLSVEYWILKSGRFLGRCPKPRSRNASLENPGINMRNSHVLNKDAPIPHICSTACAVNVFFLQAGMLVILGNWKFRVGCWILKSGRFLGRRPKPRSRNASLENPEINMRNSHVLNKDAPIPHTFTRYPLSSPVIVDRSAAHPPGAGSSGHSLFFVFFVLFAVQKLDSSGGFTGRDACGTSPPAAIQQPGGAEGEQRQRRGLGDGTADFEADRER